MKLLIVLNICAVLAVTVSGSTIRTDWPQLRPLDVEPSAAQNDGPVGRITNGQLAAPKQFPYQVGLLLYLENGSAWCGGSLISDRWILTAAHCTVNVSTGVDVYLGAFNRLDKTEEGRQIIYVSKKYIIVHEDWDEASLSHDISLIKLPFAIKFNDYIKPAQLPKISSSYSTYEDEQAIASGWGRTSDQATGATDKLEWAEVPILKNSACNKWYLGSIKSSNICIKTTGGISTCNGDSGGPLVLTGTDTLIGATSFGIVLGCQKGWPGVFTRITSYLDWIEQKSGVVNK